MYTMDHILFIFLEMADYMMKVLFALTVVFIVSPWIAIIAILSFVYLIKIRRMTVRINRDTTRLKFSLMSPVNSLI